MEINSTTIGTSVQVISGNFGPTTQSSHLSGSTEDSIEAFTLRWKHMTLKLPPLHGDKALMLFTSEGSAQSSARCISKAWAQVDLTNEQIHFPSDFDLHIIFCCGISHAKLRKTQSRRHGRVLRPSGDDTKSPKSVPKAGQVWNKNRYCATTQGHGRKDCKSLSWRECTFSPDKHRGYYVLRSTKREDGEFPTHKWRYMNHLQGVHLILQVP